MKHLVTIPGFSLALLALATPLLAGTVKETYKELVVTGSDTIGQSQYRLTIQYADLTVNGVKPFKNHACFQLTQVGAGGLETQLVEGTVNIAALKNKVKGDRPGVVTLFGSSGIRLRCTTKALGFGAHFNKTRNRDTLVGSLNPLPTTESVARACDGVRLDAMACDAIINYHLPGPVPKTPLGRVQIVGQGDYRFGHVSVSGPDADPPQCDTSGTPVEERVYYDVPFVPKLSCD
jgi:hypothetical protein